MAEPKAAPPAGNPFTPKAAGNSRPRPQFAMDTGGQRGSRRPAEAAERRGGHPLGAAGGVAGPLLMVLVFAALALVVVPQAAGYRTYSVSTNSMAPKYPAGAFLTVKPVALSELKTGDIVTFQPSPERPEVETQRIVGSASHSPAKKP